MISIVRTDWRSCLRVCLFILFSNTMLWDLKMILLLYTDLHTEHFVPNPCFLVESNLCSLSHFNLSIVSVVLLLIYIIIYMWCGYSYWLHAMWLKPSPSFAYLILYASGWLFLFDFRPFHVSRFLGSTAFDLMAL